MIYSETNNSEAIQPDLLVLRARSDAQAFGELYKKYFDVIYKFCCHRLFCKHAAQDACSEIFLSVARGMQDFRGQTDKEFRGWLWAIAVNHVNSCLRKSLVRKQLLANAAKEISERNGSVGTNEDFWPELYQAIEKLSDEHQTVISLRYFEQMEFEEIGKILNSNAGAVRGKLHRAMTNLRQQFKLLTGGELNYD